jgi:hypothetical protein
MKNYFTLKNLLLNAKEILLEQSKKGLFFLLFLGMAFILNAQFVHNSGLLSEEESVGTKLYDFHTLYFALTPGNQLEQDSALMDCSIMLSQNPITAWTDLSANIRFRNIDKNNYIDARNGGEFAKVDSIPIAFGQLYHCWFEIDMMTLSFNLFVLTEGMDSPGTIASQYAFRKQDVNELNVWSNVTPTEFENILEVSKVALVENVGDIPGITGADNITLEQNIKVYPNPAINDFTISLEGKFEFELFDYSGKSVMNGNASNSYCFDNSLAKGVYLLNVKQDKLTFSRKVIKY